MPPVRPEAPVSQEGLPNSVLTALWWTLLRLVPDTFACAVSPGVTLALVQEATELAAEDLLALCRRDPAAGHPAEVLASYHSFTAVSAFRLAHAIWLSGEPEDQASRAVARLLSEKAKVASGVEIHPAAQIGRRFVVDHGTGTVIGETATIGTDCYLLQGVVLGAVGIADNAAGRRHPSVGNRVEIGAFARILGPVQVGDDCRIDPHTVITTDVPTGYRVRLVTQTQVIGTETTEIVTGVQLCAGRLIIWGANLECCAPVFIHADEQVESAVDVESQTAERIVVRLNQALTESHPDLALINGPGPRTRIRLYHHWRTQHAWRCEGCPDRRRTDG